MRIYSKAHRITAMAVVALMMLTMIPLAAVADGDTVITELTVTTYGLRNYIPLSNAGASYRDDCRSARRYGFLYGSCCTPGSEFRAGDAT